jgi:hypothetical protein
MSDSDAIALLSLVFFSSYIKPRDTAAMLPSLGIREMHIQSKNQNHSSSQIVI